MKFQPFISRVSQRLDHPNDDLWEISHLADKQQQMGIDIIRLCVGDPDFETPAPIHSAVSESLMKGRTHYSSPQGELELRKAIAELESKTSPHACNEREVVVFPGATNALFSVLSCLLNPEDDIIVPDPMYIGYQGIFLSIGCHAIPVPLEVKNNFTLNIDLIKKSITNKTKVVLINTPGNPAGNMMSKDELSELAHFCQSKGLWLVSDEVYSMITFEQKHISLRTAALELNNIIVIDGLSKSHAMSGWRIGWAVAPEEMALHLCNFASATMYGCSQFVQDAATYTLRNNELHLETMCREYKRRRDFIVERVNNIDGISCFKPVAGMFVMIDVSRVSQSGIEFAKALLKEQRISTLSGCGFGKTTKNFVRITLAQPIETLAIAFDRIEALVKSILVH